MKTTIITSLLLTSLMMAYSSTAVLAQTSTDTEATTKLLSPSEVIKQAPASHWQSINPENTLYIELESGRVIVELNPFLAPQHTEQFRRLATEGFYDGLNFYRFVENFVAQGGDSLEKRAVKTAKKSLKSERIHHTKKPLKITYLDKSDGYAAHTGFLNGFSVGTNKDKTQYWQTHCPGAFAMARSNDPHSGGTEFYIVIGQAPRYLDKNLTVFGQVRQGIEHINTLKRRPVTDEQTKQFDNVIKTISLASQLPLAERTPLFKMDTNSTSFKALIASRKNRPNEFFIERPDYVDVCSVSVPVKEDK
jgi:cyclophilin family peptidyl-prolyl cis-trans isomerase